MIGHGNRAVSGHIVGRKLHVGGENRHILAGIIPVPGRVRPIGELIVLRSSECAAHRLSLAVGMILVCIHRRRAAAVALQVGYGIGIADEHRMNAHILIHRLVDVDQLSVFTDPFQERLAIFFDVGKRGLILRTIGDRRAQRNLECFRKLLRSGNRDLNADVDLRLFPVRVEHQILGRHDLTGEAVRYRRFRDLLRFYFIPAHKLSVCAEAGRTCRNASLVGDRSFKADIFTRLAAVVVFGQCIADAVIIEESGPVAIKAWNLTISLNESSNREVVLLVS